LLKLQNNPYITGDEIFEFYENYLADDLNIDLELKYVLTKKDFEDSETILQYLNSELGFELEKDLLKKEFSKNLGETLHLNKSSQSHLYKRVKSVRPKIPNPNIVDFYILLLNQRDEGLIEDELTDANKIKKKINKILNTKYGKDGKSISKFSKESNFEFSPKNDEELTLYEFIEVFVDRSEFITSKEAMILFDDINQTPNKTHTQARSKIISSKIYNYFSGEKN